MLYGFTGMMGTGKTLNAIKFIIENDDFAGRPIYYHGIRCLLLDYEVCDSFHGWLYGVYWPANEGNKALQRKLKQIDKERRLASLDDFPYLAFEYKRHEPMELWKAWFKKLASAKRLELYHEALSVLGIDEAELTYQHIEQMNLSWKQFHDPTLIHELPSGIVALVDEVQNIWPTRSSAKEPTPDIKYSSTHRHNGTDLVFISQDFKDVDQFIRRRLQEYRHYEFIGGDNLHQFFDIQGFDPANNADKAKAEKTKITRDKNYYGVYLSAIEHTHNVKMDPTIKSGWKMIINSVLTIIVCLSLLAGGFYYFFLRSTANANEPEQSPNEPASATTSPNPQSQPQTVDADIEYVQRFQPRFESLPFSAPAYDEMTTHATTYPELTCVISHGNCSCFTQQATAYAIDIEICINIARFGYFDPFTQSEEKTRSKKRKPNKNKLNSGGVS